MSAPVDHADMRRAIAQALSKLASEAETMGEFLCMDPNVVTAHLDRLQDIDRISQSLRELSQLLIANDPNVALSQVRLGELQRQLTADWAP